MLKNYFTIAWRNILRNKINSTINISGLAIGMACVILIALYITDELSYDKFFGNVDHVYQVNLDANFGGQQFYTSGTPPPVGIAMKKEFPEIKAYTRMYALGAQVVSNEVAGNKTQNHFTERRIFGVDSNYLQVFDYALVQGNAAECLQKGHSVVITQEMAKRYFGNDNAIGKTLLLDQYKEPFTVTAVLKNPPEQSTFRFDMLIPMIDCPMVKQFTWSWVWGQVNTYVLLNDNIKDLPAAVAALDKKFPAMVRVQAAAAFKRIGQPLDELIKKGGKWDFHLQPFTDVHLHSANIGTSYITLGDIKYVYIFAAIAFFIIVLACVNFMNLSTAQSAKRAKEVGIRKVLGSMRVQLMRQFLAEAMLYSFISAIIALLLVVTLIPAFNQLSGKTVAFASIFHNGIWLFILLLTLVTGLLAGSYPAFYLTSFNPVSVLKGVGLFKKGANQLMRNGLVVFQFGVSIALIICTIIVFQQLRFAQNKDLGLKKDNVVILPNMEKMHNSQEETFRQQLTSMPGVANASITSDVPGVAFYGFTDFYIPVPSDPTEHLSKDITLTSLVTDEYFIPSLKMQLLSGRNFSKDFNDSTSVIVNETTVKQVGWKHPLGKYITYPGGDGQQFKVIGVVKDFNVQSLRNVVTPFALFHVSSKTNQLNTSYAIISARTTEMPALMKNIENKWKEFLPGVPFEYSFLDKDYEALYRADERMGSVFGVFTFFSILVACLGLFGLSIYTAERRTKEIGVRKVLGASVQSVVTLLSADFLKLVGLAAIVSFPVAWWAMNTWLQAFAYRINIEWWVFIASGVLALLVALCTISFHAIKAALANPVKSLRTE
ncbi:MAG TPA: ABC transporter permease [Chitinophagaceae bacterium]|nr:ABC transporter permease [Chitinophagaceae bacterium]